MDAHVFRRFCVVLTDVLHDARLEKIQSPAADVHIFTFYAQQRKQILVLRHDRRNPLLFFSPERYTTGQHPPATTMRLRKYAAGRRVKALRVDWPARRLHMCFQPAPDCDSAPRNVGTVAPFATQDAAPFAPHADIFPSTHAKNPRSAQGDIPYIPQPETWISLDLRLGAVLTLGGSPDFGQDPLWPSADTVANCLAPAPTFSAAEAGDNDILPFAAVAGGDVARHPWEQWPVLTPALRRTLMHLDALEQAALLADLEYGGGDIFAYSAVNSAPSPTELLAWPLPPALRGARCERVYEDPTEALATLGSQMVLGGLERAGQQSAASPHKREAKRLGRVLEKLEREESRLRSMVAGKERALYVQSVLWYFAPDARPVDLAPFCGKACATKGAHKGADKSMNVGISVDACAPAETVGAEIPPCPFDPSVLQAQLTLRENMEALFHSAARGQRGLAMLEQRRALLRGQVSAAQDAVLLTTSLGAVTGSAAQNTSPRVGQKGLQSGDKQRKQGQPTPHMAAVGQRILPKNVEAFTSVDGLIILRGKDAKGNLALLKLGAPADLWLHVEGGPGAHTLVRRASVGQEIPQATLEQAATLAAVKSWQKGNEKVGVQCAEVRHVKPMRGASTGTVRIDKVACMVWVTMPLLPV